MTREAAYIMVYNAIKERITSGVYKVNDLLPPEPAIEKMFQVSRTTVRKAVELLSRDGFVKVRQGIGTTVTDYKVMQNLNTITSFTETLEKKGHEVSLASMHIDVIEAREPYTTLLSLSKGDAVARIKRVVCASGKPVAIITNHIPYDFVMDIEKYTGKFVSLYRFLENHYCITLDSAKDRISAGSATKEQAEQLAIKTGFPLLLIKRICISKDKPVCYDEVAIKSDMYEFEVSLHNRIQ